MKTFHEMNVFVNYHKLGVIASSVHWPHCQETELPKIGIPTAHELQYSSTVNAESSEWMPIGTSTCSEILHA